MIKTTIRLSILGVTALSLAAYSVSAAETPATPEAKQEAKAPMTKAERSGLAGPFRGTLTGKTETSVSLKERTFEVTSETKITKDGKPATLADGVIGEDMAGEFTRRDGKFIAKSVRFSGKPEASVKGAKQPAPVLVKPEVKTEAQPKAPSK